MSSESRVKQFNSKMRSSILSPTLVVAEA